MNLSAAAPLAPLVLSGLPCIKLSAEGGEVQVEITGSVRFPVLHVPRASLVVTPGLLSLCISRFPLRIGIDVALSADQSVLVNAWLDAFDQEASP